MNKRRILSLARKIEKVELYNNSLMGFNMANWSMRGDNLPEIWQDKAGHKCQTVCCIAGWAAAQTKKDGCEDDVAKEYLELSQDQSMDLFFANGVDQTKYLLLCDIPWQQAVATLRDLARGDGKVNWRAEYQGEEQIGSGNSKSPKTKAKPKPAVKPTKKPSKKKSI